ncbi:MAG: small acid-soluble spore protein SspI [Bacilli bacterium]|nr:small acid-soluble spore protein SspI [Bacilli bacterium]
MDITNYIINNFKDSDVNELKESILSSVDTNDEIVLPGLGVLFKIMWINSDENLRNNILNILINNLTKKNID